MTKQEFIEIRIAELTARRDYAAQLVMNRDMAHEVKICDAQIKALNELALVEVTQRVLPKIGPLAQAGLEHVQYWTNGSNPPQLMHTNNDGVDTVLCENHLTDTMIACANCIQPWPVDSA